MPSLQLKKIGAKPQPPLQLQQQDESDADWKVVYQRVQPRDAAKLKDYDNEIETLLVFAGLFSAVLTAFIIDVYQDLKVDYAEDSAIVLRQILAHAQGAAADSQLSALRATPSPTVIMVIGLWFTSLSLSLLSALFSIFMKQWFHAYEKWTAIAETNALQGLALRGLYQASLTIWHIPDIFTALGVLLQLALILFVVGLVAYLWTLNFIVSPIVTFWTVTMIVLSVLAIILPVFFDDCPYKFPLAYALVKLRTRSPGSDWTDRDLPIAQKSILCEDSSSHLTRAIAHTALLLDINPERLQAAFNSAIDHDIGEDIAKTMVLVRSSIQELSLPSSALLSKVVTRKGLLLEELDNERESQLLHLWQTVFESMPQAPLAVLHVMQYLTKHLVPSTERATRPSDLELRYVEVLVSILDKCKALKNDNVSQERLAVELTNIAIRILRWSESLANTPDNDIGVDTAMRVVLNAMNIAASSIPLDHAPTGLSPVTDFLPFMEKFRAYIDEIDLGRVYDKQLLDFVFIGEAILTKFNSYHSSFFCTRRRIFKSGKSDEPRNVTFTKLGLVVGTDERATWEIDLATSDSASLTFDGLLPRGFSPSWARATYDGEYICWGSRDGPLVILDRTVAQSSSPRVLDYIGQGARSRSAAFSHDGKYMLVASETSSASICEVTTGSVVITLEGHTKRVCRAAFASMPLPIRSNVAESNGAERHITEENPEGIPSEGELLPVATTSYDNTIKIWELKTGTAIATLGDGLTEVNGVAWSSDSKHLAITTGKTALIYDVMTREVTCTLEGHSKLVTNAVFSPNNELLATSSDDKTVRVWHIAKVICIATLTGEDEVNDVAFSPDGKFIAAAADDGTWIWDINENTQYSPTAVDLDRKAVADSGGAKIQNFRSAVHRVMLEQMSRALRPET